MCNLFNEFVIQKKSNYYYYFIFAAWIYCIQLLQLFGFKGNFSVPINRSCLKFIHLSFSFANKSFKTFKFKYDLVKHEKYLFCSTIPYFGKWEKCIGPTTKTKLKPYVNRHTFVWKWKFLPIHIYCVVLYQNSTILIRRTKRLYNDFSARNQCVIWSKFFDMFSYLLRFSRCQFRSRTVILLNFLSSQWFSLLPQTL